MPKDLQDQVSGLKALLDSDPGEALRSAVVLSAARPCDAEVHALVAECYLAAGDLENAEQCAARALSLKPGHAAASLVFGRVLAKRGSLQDSVASLRKALRSPRTRASAHRHIAGPLFELARSKSEYRIARNHLRTYLRHHPEEFGAWMDLAWQYYFCGRWDECDEICEKAKALDPKSARPYIMEGWSRQMQGLHAAALSRFREAVHVDPCSALAYERMGLLKHILNDYAGAVECILYSLQLNPTRPDTWGKFLHVLDGAMHRMLFPGSDSADMPDLVKEICEVALAYAGDASHGSVKLRYDVYKHLGDEQAALTEGRRYIELFPETKSAALMRHVIEGWEKRREESKAGDAEEGRQEFVATLGHLLPASPMQTEEAREIERLWRLFQDRGLPEPKL